MSQNLKEEKRLWKKGFKRVAGLDESGRGSLAGPVVAAAISLKWSFKEFGRSNLRRLILKNPKKISSKKRDQLYNILTNHHQIEWGIGMVSEKVIDRINILEATKLAMKRAIKNLEKKLNVSKRSDRSFRGQREKRRVDFLVLDGNFRIDFDTPQKSIVKADEKVFSCAAASIIAKVTRDRIMEKYHRKYRRYGFERHKGYPTKYHIKMLKKYGPSKIHRMSFKPVQNLLYYNKYHYGGTQATTYKIKEE